MIPIFFELLIYEYDSLLYFRQWIKCSAFYARPKWSKSNIALVHHYRKGCTKLSRMSAEECYRDYQSHLVRDTTIFAIKEQLQSNFLQAIKELNI